MHLLRISLPVSCLLPRKLSRGRGHCLLGRNSNKCNALLTESKPIWRKERLPSYSIVRGKGRGRQPFLLPSLVQPFRPVGFGTNRPSSRGFRGAAPVSDVPENRSGSGGVFGSPFRDMRDIRFRHGGGSARGEARKSKLTEKKRPRPRQRRTTGGARTRPRRRAQREKTAIACEKVAGATSSERRRKTETFRQVLAGAQWIVANERSGSRGSQTLSPGCASSFGEFSGGKSCDGRVRQREEVNPRTVPRPTEDVSRRRSLRFAILRTRAGGGQAVPVGGRTPTRHGTFWLACVISPVQDTDLTAEIGDRLLRGVVLLLPITETLK